VKQAIQVHGRIKLYNSDSKADKQDSEISGRKPRHRRGAKCQYCMMKRAAFIEACLSPLSALKSKICVHFQNKVPLQRRKKFKKNWLHILQRK
jgi:hypothetical protein